MDIEGTTVLYEQSGLPVFQNKTYATYAEAVSCPVGNVALVQNASSGIVENREFDPALMIYDENYQNEQGTSLVFQEHLGRVADLVAAYMGMSDLVEVGCGKGLFLEMLLARGAEVIGFDPAYEGKNPRVRREYFRAGLNISTQGVILRHVLEHIQNPVSFLNEIRDANGGQGKIYIEVPCFDWICEHRAWFDIFYEHVNYFRLSDFQRMFGHIHYIEKTFGGQYISVVADLASLRQLPLDVEGEVRLNGGDLLPEGKLSATVDGPSIVWGASSKGVIFSTLRMRSGLPVDAVVDINPAKQGRYLPVTGLKVSTPQEISQSFSSDATVYVMNSNYLEEIRRLSGERFRYVCVDQ